MKNKVKTIALFTISLLACILSIIAIFRPLPNTDKTQWREIYGYREGSYSYRIAEKSESQDTHKQMHIRFNDNIATVKILWWSGKETIHEYIRTNITYVDYMTY